MHFVFVTFRLDTKCISKCISSNGTLYSITANSSLSCRLEIFYLEKSCSSPFAIIYGQNCHNETKTEQTEHNETTFLHSNPHAAEKAEITISFQLHGTFLHGQSI
jgi:hypothetical protein